MNKQQHGSKAKKAFYSKPALRWLTVVVVILLGGMLALQILNPTLLPGVINQTQTSKKGQGGEPKLVEQYHSEAVAAWKAGDKQKAKELAQKGLDENDQLTPKQQLEVPDQMGKAFEMYEISRGIYDN